MMYAQESAEIPGAARDDTGQAILKCSWSVPARAPITATRKKGLVALVPPVKDKVFLIAKCKK
eukprot:2938314-Pleurochrysis_carterae.AAC.1